MNLNVNRFWWFWLLSAVSWVILFGLALVFFPAQMERFFNWMLFASQTAVPIQEPPAVDYLRFVYGVLGAVMVGWGVSMVWVLIGPYGRGERAGWLALATPLAIWYVIDSSLSVTQGFWQNAVLNSLFAALFALPLAATFNTCMRRAHRPADRK